MTNADHGAPIDPLDNRAEIKLGELHRKEESSRLPRGQATLLLPEKNIGTVSGGRNP